MKNICFTLLIAASLCSSAQAQAGKNEAVLNPNRASTEQLLALGQLDSTLVEGIVEHRPFLGMEAFDTYLSPTLNDSVRAIVYKALFLPINLNTASDAEMKMVPGVGKRMAHEFEEYRPYKNMIQWCRQIEKYVDDKELARLEQYVFVPLELNEASQVDMLTIPGVGKRMAHEFEEYRPYKNMAQWRREIGKYVDDKELARLERYVYLKQ